MNNFDPTRPMVPASGGADLTAFFAAMQHQMQAQNLPQMQMPLQANMPGVQWQAQFWPQHLPQQQQQPQSQQQQWIPGPGPSAGPQLQPVPQPSVQSLQSMLASVYQLCVQQQQQQQVPHLPVYLPPLPQPPQPPQPPPPAQQQSQAAQLSSPVGAVIDDEARLIEALKGSKGKGITPRQALEKLHGVNNHSASDWKDYFLDHHERLCAHVKPPPLPRLTSVSNGTSSSQAGRSSINTSERSTNVPQRQHPPKSRSHPTNETFSHRAEPRLPEPTKVPRSQNRRPSPPPTQADVEDSESPSRSPCPPAKTPPQAPILGSRRTRGEPIAHFHAGTRIPFTESRMKPSPPLEEDAGTNGRFTPADHRFFIHYLRWRLAKDPLVTRDVLYGELAEQTPSHDADAWKRHWDNHPQLPDQVVIEAGKRAAAPHSLQRSDKPLQHDPTGEGSVESAGEDNSDEEREQDEGQNTQRTKRAPVRRAGKKGLPITEEDLRVMARFMFERGWSVSGPKRRWIEFAERPENEGKRTYEGWYSITIPRSPHRTALEKYLEELHQERGLASKPSNEAQSGDPPVVDLETSSEKTDDKEEQKPTPLEVHKHSPPTPTAIFDLEGSRSRKRTAEEPTPKDESPERKRPREGTPSDVIVVSD
ncbi:hypothetical protein VTO73DRAFT_14991 [Trametes versicolor]